jgi:hypothetical protein
VATLWEHTLLLDASCNLAGQRVKSSCHGVCPLLVFRNNHTSMKAFARGVRRHLTAGRTLSNHEEEEEEEEPMEVGHSDGDDVRLPMDVDHPAHSDGAPMDVALDLDPPMPAHSDDDDEVAPTQLLGSPERRVPAQPAACPLDLAVYSPYRCFRAGGCTKMAARLDDCRPLVVAPYNRAQLGGGGGETLFALSLIPQGGPVTVQRAAPTRVALSAVAMFPMASLDEDEALVMEPNSKKAALGRDSEPAHFAPRRAHLDPRIEAFLLAQLRA